MSKMRSHGHAMDTKILRNSKKFIDKNKKSSLVFNEEDNGNWNFDDFDDDVNFDNSLDSLEADSG
jgi:hypothetical protein